jgi:hypothetical protein
MQIDLNLETTKSLLLKVVAKAKEEFGDHKEEFAGYMIGTEEGIDQSKVLKIEDLKTEFVLTEEQVADIEKGDYEKYDIGGDGKFFVVRVFNVSGFKTALGNTINSILFPPAA